MKVDKSFDISNINKFDVLEIKDIEAIEIQNNVYFRLSDKAKIKKVGSVYDLL